MTFAKKTYGFSLIEVLLVITVMTVLLSMGGALASKFANRRSVDRVTTSISSTLQLVKLKATRQGVEYQATLTFDPMARTLTIATERGDSNNDSTNYVEETSQTVGVINGAKVQKVTTKDGKKVLINIDSETFNFNPNGVSGVAGAGTIIISPANDKKGERCGGIIISPLGRISVIQGNWNPSLAANKRCKSFK